MEIKKVFGPADILIPVSGYEKWACNACDQYTSQEEYWERAYAIAGDSPSCLHIVLPEVYLEKGDSEQRIKTINENMRSYLQSGVFSEYKNAMILVERSLSNGRIRRGVVGAFALVHYSYEQDAKSLIRPTEGTVLSRIPPRVEIRKDAVLELPHIMVLMDDREKSIIESIDTATLKLVYDFPLMLGGGHLRGWLLGENEQRKLCCGLEKLAESSGSEDDRLLFAVGDGNHSLATAKAASALIGSGESRWALAELVNIHDEAVEFEPIYRVLFGLDIDDFVLALHEHFPGNSGRPVDYFGLGTEGRIYVDGLESKLLQEFIDAYVSKHSSVFVDYIHGQQAVRELAMRPGALGFIFGGIGKDELFDYVRQNGIFPRKTFSIGQAEDKRYYMEARRIR